MDIREDTMLFSSVHIVFLSYSVQNKVRFRSTLERSKSEHILVGK